MKINKLTPQLLRIILATSLVLVVVISTAGFTYVHGVLTEYAINISKKNVDAKASETTIQSLESIKSEIDQSADVKAIADKIRLSDNHPEFVIREHLQDIAKKRNISIQLSSTAASSDGTTPGAGTAPAPVAVEPAEGAAGAVGADGQAAQTQASPAPGGTFNVTLTIQTTFTRNTYKNYLLFLHDLETSLPKMKINGASVSPGSTGSIDGNEAPSSGSSFSVDPLALEIYIKQ